MKHFIIEESSPSFVRKSSICLSLEDDGNALEHPKLETQYKTNNKI